MPNLKALWFGFRIQDLIGFLALVSGFGVWGFAVLGLVSLFRVKGVPFVSIVGSYKVTRKTNYHGDFW